MIAYINGSQVNSISAGSYNIGTNAGNLIIGAAPWNPDSYEATGIIDEIRISGAARSADWIKTEYNNQSDPTSFYSVGASSCFLGGFSCNRKITIPGDKVSGSGNLTDFPLLIKVENDCNLKTSTNGGHIQDSNGFDILFTDASGAIQLDHEIEEYDGVRGDLTAWVKIPTLYGSSDTDIYMYYGKSGLTCDPANPAGVWDGNYKSVWHLEEDPSGTVPQMKDSTANGNHGTSSGSMTSGDQLSGKIGGSLDFDGNNDYLSTTNSFNNPQDFTVSAWFKTSSASGKRLVGFESNQTGEYSGSWDRHIYVGTDGKVYFGSFSGSTDVAVSTNTLNDDTWHYAVGVRDDGVNRIRLYIDGNLNDSTYNSAAENYTGRWRIGSYKTSGWPNGQDGYFPGVIDEVRFSNTARSADWIQTEYDNQRDPTSFSIMGNDSCGGQYGFNYQYCKKITVDHTQVNSDLTNFPLLVNITGDGDLKTVANGGRVYHNLGYDIVFKSPSCGQLDHEVEMYDGSAGTLIAWVRVPTLSSSSDTEIYMYYGDSGVTCSSENPDGLWDPSIYEAVYHLSDDYSDSTSNKRDGTNYGTTFVDSQIGKGALFTPSNGWDHIELGSWNVNDNDLVIQAWVWPNDFNQNDPRIVSKCRSTASGAQDHVFMLSLYNGDNGDNRMRSRVKTGTDNYSGTVELFGNSPNGYLPSAQQWYFLTASYVDSSDQMKLWRDATGNATAWQNGWLRQNSWPVWIGASPYGSSNSEYSWDGVLDEVRIISEPRSTDWIQTEHNNQTNPNFYSISSCFEQTTKMTEGWEEDF